MRINKFVATASGLSRRAADIAIHVGRVKVNGSIAETGQRVADSDVVTLDDRPLRLPEQMITIMLHKPVGYVCSRHGQGSRTVYDLLPEQFQHLKPVGRLDKDSSGLLLLTNDGELANQLTHPSFQKRKLYEVHLDLGLQQADLQRLARGVRLEDGISHLAVEAMVNGQDSAPNRDFLVSMTEGRNRQIRRTFAAVGYTVVALHRIGFGECTLGTLAAGHYQTVAAAKARVTPLR